MSLSLGRPWPERPILETIEQGVTLWELLVVASILSVLALIVGSNLPSARQQAQVSACETNIRAIATAAEQYYSAVQTYPTGTAAAVTTTLFQNPNETSVTYLGTQPVDPADPTQTGTYKYTYTAPTATVAGFYVISCPGIHPKETLSAIPGASSETSGQIYLNSQSNLYTQ
jgi:prepilin-type N-terminal cleavage/methylation domain-containing protein